MGFSAWWLLTVLLLLSVLSSVHRFLPAMLVEPIKDDLRLSDVEMSMILGPAFSVFYCLFAFPLGWAADHFDRRRVIFIGTLFWTIATVMSGFANSFSSLFLARAVVAIGETALIPAAFSLIADSFPAKRLNTALAINSMGPKMGTSLAFFVGAVALTLASTHASNLPFAGELAPWQMTFVLVGLPGIAICALLFTFPEPPRQQERDAPEDKSEFRDFLRKERAILVPLLLGFGAIAISSGALLNWVPTYMGRHFGWKPVHIGSALGIINMLGALMLLPKGMIVDWLTARAVQAASLRFYIWLLAAFTPVAVIAFLIADPIWFLILYGLAAVVAIPYILYISAAIQMFTPSHFRGRVLSIFLIVVMLVQGGGPIFVAVITDYVLQDPARIGVSLAVSVGISMGGSYLFLRAALAPLMRRIAQDGAEDVSALHLAPSKN